MDKDARLLTFLQQCLDAAEALAKKGKWLWDISDNSTDEEDVV